jgi:ESS family glutamate:Na+ symporter
MADTAHTTGAAMGFGYKQLFYEPFLGGGILTAPSVPLIISIGSLTSGIASAGTTAGLIIWGVVRNRHARQTRTNLYA